MWFNILQFLNIAGVVSNAFLIAFTSSWGSKYSDTDKLWIVIIFEVRNTTRMKHHLRITMNEPKKSSGRNSTTGCVRDLESRLIKMLILTAIIYFARFISQRIPVRVSVKETLLV